ncbi:PLP-dependent cysteine synthase family protein [Grimontia marina]|uniref:cysteine synthase n=1 Tax=Grimontia marina TaxID=646534 RepID=A0A128FEM2_9GAMM|nr:cysteine synthase family protein [Grimontia marina]CZF85218.1 Cysteine synthase [Grimontia marina]
MKLCTAMHQMIGETPMLALKFSHSDWTLWLKVEKNNPGQSMKDRMAREMLFDALRSGRLKRGGTVVESSSGNTATALAYMCAEIGINFIAVVDHHAAPDKLAAVKAYGGKIHLLEGDFADDEVATVARIETARNLAASIDGGLFMDQCNNAANPAGYTNTLAVELQEQLGDRLDGLVCCVGTGGSIVGVGEALRVRYPSLEIIGVEPVGSVIFGFPSGPYWQSGTGMPEGDVMGPFYDPDLLDEGVRVSDAEAFTTCRYLAREHGLLVGGSAGGAIYEAIKRCAKRQGSGNMVCLICDGGEKYLNTVYNDEWLHSKGLYHGSVYEYLSDVIAKPQRIETPWFDAEQEDKEASFA